MKTALIAFSALVALQLASANSDARKVCEHVYDYRGSLPNNVNHFASKTVDNVQAFCKSHNVEFSQEEYSAFMKRQASEIHKNIEKLGNVDNMCNAFTVDKLVPLCLLVNPNAQKVCEHVYNKRDLLFSNLAGFTEATFDVVQAYCLKHKVEFDKVKYEAGLKRDKEEIIANLGKVKSVDECAKFTDAVLTGHCKNFVRE